MSSTSSKFGSQFAVRSSQFRMFTPLPPTRTGVAHYSSLLIPALQRQIDLEVVSAPSTANREPRTANNGKLRTAIYMLGNNPHHEWIYKAAMEEPGVIVLHDMVLHHLIVEMTLARGDAGGYVAALAANHGAAGAAWARGRAAGLHSEMGNFLFPASIDIANRSRAVIVHNHYAADRLRSFGVTTPIHVVPHPYEPQHLPKGGRNFVIGLFGFLTSAKRSEVILEAFRKARETNRDVRLLVAGEPAPNIDVHAFAGDAIKFTGYVPDDQFANYFAEVDRIVNLRYPSAGETSGTLIRALDAGKPVAVSDYAQFAELPDGIVTKIPLGDGEVDALANFFAAKLPDRSAAQRKWLEENASIERTVEGYLAVLNDGPLTRRFAATSPQREVLHSTSPGGRGRREAAGEGQSPNAIKSTLPLFPQLALVNILTIKNIGDTTLKAKSYGEPGYHLIANGRWLELPRDLAPGESATIDIPSELRGTTVTLMHAMQGIPIVEPEAWARVEIH